MQTPVLHPWNFNNNYLYGLPEPPLTNNDSYAARVADLKKALLDYVDLKTAQIIGGNKNFTGDINTKSLSSDSYLKTLGFCQADDFIIRAINNDQKGLSFYYYDQLGAQLRYTESGGQFTIAVVRGGNPAEINIRGGTGQIAFVGKTGVNVFYSFVPNGAEFQVNGGAYVGTANAMIPSPGAGNLTVEKITKTSGIVVSFVTKTTDYNIKNTDCTVNGDATSGNITFFLPSAASLSPGQQFKSAKVDSSANTVSIQAAAGDNIIGLSKRVLSSTWESIVYETDGNKTWFIY